MKSLLRWAGSKAQLIPTLAAFWPAEARRYVEPFCGSASLYFAIQPQAALLADLNAELISAWQQLKRNCEVIIECLQRMPLGEAAYYQIRGLDPAALSPNEAAARFFYLNRFCFNGLYRTNRSGAFNVPYGSKHTKLLFDPHEIRQCAFRLSNATLVHADFEHVVNRTTSGDFLYLDPPYATDSIRIFNGYGKDVFSPKDLHRLFEALEMADQRKVRFVLSYADVPEIDPFKDRWRHQNVVAKRNIAGFSGARRRVTEILITNCGAI